MLSSMDFKQKLTAGSFPILIRLAGQCRPLEHALLDNALGVAGGSSIATMLVVTTRAFLTWF